MATFLFRLMVWAYPPSLRREFGDAMAATVAESWASRRTVRSRLRMLGDLFADFFANWPRAWRSQSPIHHDPSRPHRRSIPALFSDLQDIARLFRRSPRFALSAVLLLATGIGASTAVFSLADATLLRPLSIPGAERVAQTTFSWSYPDFQDVIAQQTMLTDVAGWAYPPLGIERNGTTLAVTGAGVSGNYFRLADQRPLIGRLLNSSDDVHGVAPAAVLSERLWRREFNADPSILGATINVNRRPVTIVGVVPAAFRGFSLQIAPELFIPLRSVPELTSSPQDARALLTNRGRVWFNFAGRMNNGVTQSGADQHLRQIYYR